MNPYRVTAERCMEALLAQLFHYDVANRSFRVRQEVVSREGMDDLIKSILDGQAP